MYNDYNYKIINNTNLIDHDIENLTIHQNKSTIKNYNNYKLCLLIFILLSAAVSFLYILLNNNTQVVCATIQCINIPNIGVVEGVILPFTFNHSKTYIAWKGLPFAEMPINNLRWKPPVPKPQWNDILIAKEFKSVCYQDKIVNSVGYNQSEDCLYLNIFRSNKFNGTKLPVMLWIYGGGFIMGESNNPKYNPQYLIDRDIIFVSFNYRLGLLGFAVHKFLDEEDPHHPTSGNYGLLDQRLAMKWVKDNIAAFGGDENNITIFGESAGSISICLHLVDAYISNLFNAAILQSGFLFKICLHLYRSLHSK